MGKMHLPPGFRFHPTDVELVKFYLKRKMMGKKIYLDPIAEVDIYKFAPWDLPGKSNLMSGDLKWYFFCRMEKKYASGGRFKRATEIGFWKATGKDRPVLYNSEVAGMIKTLVFHCGKAPKGERTNWVMHEYRIEDKGLAQREVVQDACVLCVLFQKDGPGPRNGAQYGAPFKEEDWSDGEDRDCTEPFSVSNPTVTALPEPAIGLSPIASALHVPDNQFVEPLAEPCASSVLPLANNMLPSMNSSGNDVAEFSQIPDGDVLSMLDNFSDENFWNGCIQNEKTDYANDAGSAGVFTCSRSNSSFSGLSDFHRLDGVSVDFYNHRGAHNSNQMHSLGTSTRKSSFLEILDLDAPLDTPLQAHQPDALQSCNHDCRASPSCNHQNHFSVLLHSAESVQMHSRPTPTPQVPRQSDVFSSKSF